MELVEHLIITLFQWAIATVALASLVVAFWSRRWPSVQGTISVSLTDIESGWNVGPGNRLGRTVEERHNLAYSYEVDGQPYLGSRVRPLLNVRSQVTSNLSDRPLWSTARSLGNKFRAGDTVEVFYCPIYPLWSSLLPESYGEALFVSAVAVVLFVVF